MIGTRFPLIAFLSCSVTGSPCCVSLALCGTSQSRHEAHLLRLFPLTLHHIFEVNSSCLPDDFARLVRSDRFQQKQEEALLLCRRVEVVFGCFPRWRIRRDGVAQQLSELLEMLWADLHRVRRVSGVGSGWRGEIYGNRPKSKTTWIQTRIQLLGGIKFMLTLHPHHRHPRRTCVGDSDS